MFAGQRTFLDPVLRPIERGIYRLAGIDPARQMDGKQYAIAFVVFGLLGPLLLYALLRLQAVVPAVNSAHLTTPLTPDLAFNFSLLEVAIFGLVAGLYALISLDGESAWLEGVLLCAFYLILGVGTFVAPA